MSSREQQPDTALVFHRANLWVSENPTAWAKLCDLAQQEIRANRRFGMQHLVERVRWLDLVDVHGKPVKISNDHVAFLARRLCQEFPEARNFVELRPSMFDRFF